MSDSAIAVIPNPFGAFWCLLCGFCVEKLQSPAKSAIDVVNWNSE